MIVCVHEMSKQIKNRVIRHFVIGKLNGQTYTHCSSHKTSWPSQSFTTSRYAHSHTETIHNMNMQKNKGKTREKNRAFHGEFHIWHKNSVLKWQCVFACGIVIKAREKSTRSPLWNPRRRQRASEWEWKREKNCQFVKYWLLRAFVHCSILGAYS